MRLDFWRLGQLAPSKFRAQDIWRLDFWWYGQLALRKFPVQTFGGWDIWRFPEGLFTRIFPGWTFGAQDISCPDIWWKGTIGAFKNTYPYPTHYINTLIEYAFNKTL